MRSGFLNTNSSRSSIFTEISDVLPEKKYKLSDFDLERHIGTGNFSNVWFVSLKSNPEKCFALKIFDRMLVQKLKVEECLVQERRNMVKLMDPGHPNIIKYEGSFKDAKNLYLLYEIADEGELWDFIRFTGIPYEKLAIKLIWQLVNAVEYIHSKNIVHRDIKCENIVVSGKGMLKLIDFGSSIDLDFPVPTVNGTQHCIGTPNFMSPESVQNEDSGKLRDLWNLGCTIYQILTGYPPFYGSTDYFVYNRILANDLKISECISEDAKDLIRRLIVMEPEKRLGVGGFDEIKRHKIFEDLQPGSIKNDFFQIDLEKNLSAQIDENWEEFKSVCKRFDEALLKMREYESKNDFSISQDLEDEMECIIKETECTSDNCGALKCRIHGKGGLVHFRLEDWRYQREKEMSEADKWLKQPLCND